MSEDRLQVLKMVEAGQVSTEEALRLLAALEEADAAHTGADAADEMDLEEENAGPPADLPNPSGWWIYPTAAGAVVMAIGAPLVALGLSGRAAIFWAIFCGWIPFFVGLFVLTLGVWSRNARWLHLRINNVHSGRRTLALSLPLPLTLTAWMVRLIRPYVPELKNTAVDEAILALRDGVTEGEEQPLYVDVQDDEGGEQVMIYIG
jgi:hypothetical protein